MEGIVSKSKSKEYFIFFKERNALFTQEELDEKQINE